MSEKRAFALREDAKESFASAAAAVAGGGNVVVEELLRPKKDADPDVNRAIVVDSVAEADALATIPILKEVSIPEANELNKAGQSTARKGA